MKVFYDPAFCHTTIAWDTTRKAAAIAESLQLSPLPGVEVVAPQPVTDQELNMTIDTAYLEALRTGAPLHLARSNDLGWDTHLLDAVRSSSGGVRDAVLTSLETRCNAGSLSSGLHHARPSHGAGYCTVNGLALAARAALERGAHRVLILDLDAHCGGGTAASIDDLSGVEQVDVSVIAYDSYHCSSNASLIMSAPSSYLDDIERALAAVSHRGTPFDVVLYNAGMDPHQRAGGVDGITTEMLARREELVFEWARSLAIPVAWVLAGGYTTSMGTEDLVALHRMTIAAATR